MQRLVYLTYMLMVSSAGVTFVFLEDIETEYGLPAWGIGLISALSFASTVFASLIIAPFGDRGYLKALGAFAFLTGIVGNIWIGYADALWSIAISRVLTGAGAGLFSVVGRKALIGRDTSDSGEKIGGFISAAVLGFVAGPGIGAQLAEYGGIKTPYLVIAALLVLLAVPTMKWLSTVPIAVSESVSVRAMIPLLRKPGVRAAVAAQVAVYFNIGVFSSTVDEYLTDLGLSNAQVGLVLLVIASPLLIVPKYAGRYIDTVPRPATIMLSAFALFVPIVLLLGVWTGVAAFVFLAFAQTLMESTVFPSTAKVVLNETGAKHSAIATGLLDVGGSSAAAFSAFFAPVLYDATDGPLGPFGMSGIVALCLLVVGWSSIRQRDLSREASGQPKVLR